MTALESTGGGGGALAESRRQDVVRRHRRVHQALAELSTDAAEITISAVARRARVHRSFIHRHPDLRAAVLAAADAASPASASTGGELSRRSLLADNANLRDQTRRLAQHVRALEDRLSDLLGTQAFQRSGLGAPQDSAALEAKTAHLQQQIFDLRRALEERDEELAAAREAHRRLMAEMNRGGGRGEWQRQEQPRARQTSRTHVSPRGPSDQD